MVGFSKGRMAGLLELIGAANSSGGGVGKGVGGIVGLSVGKNGDGVVGCTVSGVYGIDVV